MKTSNEFIAAQCDQAGEIVEMVQPVQTAKASFERMFNAACVDLGLINEALGLDPDDGGAQPILEAISELKAAITQPVQTANLVPLTGEQIDAALDSIDAMWWDVPSRDTERFARAIEAAHGIAQPVQPTPDIHSCSYFCNRPACIKSQRDELRAELKNAF